MRIGLTGGIAAGKSTVSARLAELGACVIDYDMLARKVVEPGGAALPRIVETFGGQVLRADGTLDRAWLAEHVFGPFAEPGSRERLDSIEHPLIYREAERLEQTERESLTRFRSDSITSLPSRRRRRRASNAWSRRVA